MDHYGLDGSEIAQLQRDVMCDERRDWEIAIEAKLNQILTLLQPKPKRKVKRTVETHTWVELWLDEVWKEYPKRAGSNPRD